MMTHDEIIAVVSGHKAGAKVQFCQHRYDGSRGDWIDCEAAPCWNFMSCDYRVAPEPRKARELWVVFVSDRIHMVAAHTEREARGLTNAHVSNGDNAECIRVREVLDEKE